MRIKRTSMVYMYLAGLLLSLHYAFTIYINSSFLSQFFPEKIVSLLYTSGAIGTFIALVAMPRLVHRFGPYRLLVFGLIAEIAALFGLLYSTSPDGLAVFFFMHQMLPPLLLYFLDIFLESAITTEKITGRMRSNYLTINNLAFLLSPIIVGRVISISSYRFVYLLSTIFVTFMLVIVIDHFRRRETHSFKEVSFTDSVQKFHYRRGLVTVYMLSFLLQSFYALMVIFTPIYLHTVIGFGWQTIGLIFTVMLVPFVVFEAPLGRMFDRIHGEHEVIMAGFLCMTLAALGIFGINTTSTIVWAGLLFLSRTGAAFVEIGTEYSFFKRVTDGDAGFISVFRTCFPLSYIVAPALASILHVFLPLRFVFLMVSAITFVGIMVAYRLNRLPRHLLRRS